MSADSYEDILELPHHVSHTHPHMPRKDRAAQFAPFAALSGYEAAIHEAARRTVPRMELEEDEKEELDRTFSLLASQVRTRGFSQAVQVTFFLPDQRKTGGNYLVSSGTVRKIHLDSRILDLEEADGSVRTIPLADICQLELLS